MPIKDSILAAVLAAVLPFTCVAYANPEAEPENAAVDAEVIEDAGERETVTFKLPRALTE